MEREVAEREMAEERRKRDQREPRRDRSPEQPIEPIHPPLISDGPELVRDSHC